MTKKDLSFELAFTNTYKKYMDAHPALREAMCNKVQFPAVLTPIKEEDYFAGRVSYRAVGFSPQPGGFCYFCDTRRIQNEIEMITDSEEYRDKLQDLVEFWETENTEYKVRSAYSDGMKKALPSDAFTSDSGAAFPLYRMGGMHLDYGKLVTLGLPGLRAEVQRYLEEAKHTEGNHQLFKAMLISLDTLADCCEYYAQMAEEMAKSAASTSRQKMLLEMSQSLRNIATAAPQTLREAIQLVWLYVMVAGVFNYGRMDVYLGSFYANDIDAGRLTEAEALELLQGFWRLMVARGTTWDGRVVIGGMGRPNPETADRFAMAAMEASRTVQENNPQLTLRFYEGMNPELMEKALQVIGEGRTFPMLYNDDINVPAVQKAFEVSWEEAEQYVPFGCGEYILEHRSVGTPSGVINLLKALEVTLHNGKDPLTGRSAGLALGEPDSFDSFEKLMEAYQKQVEYFIDYLAEQEELEYRIAGETAPFLYASMLYDSCMERGKGIFAGGAKYLGGTLESYGDTNTSDSLAAIKELVYDRKMVSLDEMVKALDTDFEGYEALQKLMLDAPKYGNDNPAADEIAQKVHNHVCRYTRDQRERTGLHSYMIVRINNSCNTTFGRYTAASADGRKAYEPMANANAPSGGNDRNGITALLNSMVKLEPDIHAGMVQNFKFSRDTFVNSKEKLKALLHTYFEKGGTQAMITVVNRGDLEKALVEPQKYRHVFVRVGGFSARFVDLEPGVQKEILSRTLY